MDGWIILNIAKRTTSTTCDADASRTEKVEKDVLVSDHLLVATVSESRVDSHGSDGMNDAAILRSNITLHANGLRHGSETEQGGQYDGELHGLL